MIDIVLLIPKKQARYFQLKKFLPSQEIIKEHNNGSIEIKYKVTTQNEVIGLLKQWIPYIKVIKPKSLKKMFDGIIKDYN